MASPTPGADMTPAEFLKLYSSEPRLIPLKRLGVGKLNRGGQPLNGSHVMTLMRRWHQGRKSGGEDFQNYRYKPARVYEPNPLDLQETLRHTNLMAAKDTRIRPVADDTGKGLYGLFSKSHCWSALWGLTGRSIRDGEEGFVLAPPSDQPDLLFAEEHGLWCEVVRWEGVANHPHILKELMRSENYDAKTALAEDEVSLFRDIFDMLHQGELPKRTGESEWDVVLRIVTSIPGNQFAKKDVECRYNLAKVLGQCHVDFLVSFCSSWVDFKLITVPNKCV